MPMTLSNFSEKMYVDEQIDSSDLSSADYDDDELIVERLPLSGRINIQCCTWL